MQQENDLSDTILAINFGVSQNEKLVGAALVNLTERVFQVSEFVDNDYFSNLESLILQTNNSSVDARFKLLLNTPPNVSRDKVEEVAKMCEVDFLHGNKKDFVLKGLSGVLNALLKESFAYKIEESEMEVAM